VGKLALYTLWPAFHRPQLPILLDVGTDNRELLDDPLTSAGAMSEVRGQEYDEFIEAFVRRSKQFPLVLLQWEDFSKHNAPRILERVAIAFVPSMATSGNRRSNSGRSFGYNPADETK
jgi:malate dehydrogenase (oxaloacetate-decarboxylating)